MEPEPKAPTPKTPPYRRRPRKQTRPGRKLLGVDIGERRVGLAVSDDTGAMAFPMRIIDLKREPLAAIADAAREQRVEGIVVGLPKGRGGVEGYQAREVRAAVAELEPLLDVPVVYADELLTSAIADRVLADSGVRARERRGKLDAIAASIMLQGYLDDHPLGMADEDGRET
jgi:putative Holliday junction resolvase